MSPPGLPEPYITPAGLVADWVIFAGLSQALWYSEGLEVEWFNGFKREDPSDRIQASNIYKLSGCRDKDEIVLTGDQPN